MNKQEKKKFNAIVKRVWVDVARVLNNQNWEKYADELYKLSLKESKQHDNIRAGHIKRGITISEEARFFALSRLLEAVYNLDSKIKLSIKDYNHVQKSVFMAYALAEEFEDKIKAIITKEEAVLICSADYCELIEVE